MTDMNNRSMNDNNENRNNDPKERMRKKVKKAAGIALCAVLAGGLAAGSFEGECTDRMEQQQCRSCFF